MTTEAMEVLKNMDWRDGNIRTLRNCIRAMTEKHINFQLTPMAIPNWAKGQRSFSSVRDYDHHAGNEIKISIPLESTTFEAMADHGFLALIRWHLMHNPKLSKRSLATNLGLPKSTFTSKLMRLTQKGLISEKELETLTN